MHNRPTTSPPSKTQKAPLSTPPNYRPPTLHMAFNPQPPHSFPANPPRTPPSPTKDTITRMSNCNLEDEAA
ncbi:hypothetical protein SUGI_0883620 [Cryptomeria japonica]|nr:hypothetical protein SUGI_0883620 [Cryptomeria japonica]